MTALTRYYLSLLLRSGRWLPPTMLYAACVAVGAQGSSRVGDALGYAGAVLVPAVAWLTRATLTAEPEAARHCVAAATGPRRACVAALTAALTGGVVLMAFGAVVMLANVGRVRPGEALAAGALTMAACALAGTAVGALCNPPVIPRAVLAIPVTGIAALGVIVAGASPVNAAVRGITPSDAGARLPLVPAFVVVVGTAVCWAVSARAAARREFHAGGNDG